MLDYQKYFFWSVERIEYYYIYFLAAAIVAFFLVVRSKSKYKFEVYFISFFLLTGSINKILTISIPGFTLFEIQPIRLIFFLLLFIIIRKTALSRKLDKLDKKQSRPWFEVALFAFVTLLITSLIVNASEIGIDEVLQEVFDALAFIVILFGIRLMADPPSYQLIGKSIIVGAIATSIISLVQLSIDPYFLRIGDFRVAFGEIIRANGIFDTEYFNSYYLITAIIWVLISHKKDSLKFVLVLFFTMGIMTTFQRMSWIILGIVLMTYFLYIRRTRIGKVVFYGLLGLTLVLSISLFYYRDIMRSSLVQERLTDSIERRAGYYTLVLENIGNRPLFGYGDLKNEVYYRNIMRITEDRNRATAATGDLHSGYFSVLYLYGIPACVFFILFVLTTVVHFAKLIRENIFFILPFLLGIIYMIGNLTNTFLFLKYLTILLAVHIGIGMGIKDLKAKMVTMPESKDHISL